MGRHYPKSKFAIFLYYIKEEVSNEVGFFHAYKHESFLQVETMIFDGDGEAFPTAHH